MATDRNAEQAAGETATHLDFLAAIKNRAYAWWMTKRPVGWHLEEHLANPIVNCVGSEECHLALSVAEWQGWMVETGQ